MITCVINITEIAPNLIACHMDSDSPKGTQFERAYAGILDVALRSAMEFTLEKMKAGEIIEGEHIEGYVKAQCERAFRKAGFQSC